MSIYKILKLVLCLTISVPLCDAMDKNYDEETYEDVWANHTELRTLAKKGDLDAQYTYGNLFWETNFLQEHHPNFEFDKAFSYWRLAANQGHEGALDRLNGITLRFPSRITTLLENYQSITNETLKNSQLKLAVHYCVELTKRADPQGIAKQMLLATLKTEEDWSKCFAFFLDATDFNDDKVMDLLHEIFMDRQDLLDLFDKSFIKNNSTEFNIHRTCLSGEILKRFDVKFRKISIKIGTVNIVQKFEEIKNLNSQTSAKNLFLEGQKYRNANHDDPASAICFLYLSNEKNSKYAKKNLNMIRKLKSYTDCISLSKEDITLSSYTGIKDIGYFLAKLELANSTTSNQKLPVQSKANEKGKPTPQIKTSNSRKKSSKSLKSLNKPESTLPNITNDSVLPLISPMLIEKFTQEPQGETTVELHQPVIITNTNTHNLPNFTNDHEENNFRLESGEGGYMIMPDILENNACTVFDPHSESSPIQIVNSNRRRSTKRDITYMKSGHKDVFRIQENHHNKESKRLNLSNNKIDLKKQNESDVDSSIEAFDTLNSKLRNPEMHTSESESLANPIVRSNKRSSNRKVNSDKTKLEGQLFKQNGSENLKDTVNQNSSIHSINGKVKRKNISRSSIHEANSQNSFEYEAGTIFEHFEITNSKLKNPEIVGPEFDTLSLSTTTPTTIQNRPLTLIVNSKPKKTLSRKDSKIKITFPSESIIEDDIKKKDKNDKKLNHKSVFYKMKKPISLKKIKNKKDEEKKR